MSIAVIIFYAFAFLAAASAISLIFIKNVFHGALLLIVCLLSLAAIYVVAFAEFVAVTQILIYAGGILVVIIFGIMITTKISNEPLRVENGNWFSGFLAALSLLAVLVYFFATQQFSSSGEVVHANAIEKIGIDLMTDFLLPFEVAGILLLMALIGAAVIASKNSKKI